VSRRTHPAYPLKLIYQIRLNFDDNYLKEAVRGEKRFSQFALQLLDNLRFIPYLLQAKKEFQWLWRLYRRLDKGLFLKNFELSGVLGILYEG